MTANDIDGVMCGMNKAKDSVLGFTLAFWRTQMTVRYLVVGVVNFIFGYGAFAGLYWGLVGVIADWLLSLGASALGITFSFLTHRMITYRSTGVWWKEYLRFYLVYGVQTVLNAALVWLLVTECRHNAYLVQFLLAAGMTIATYWVHKFFSFGKGNVR